MSYLSDRYPCPIAGRIRSAVTEANYITEALLPQGRIWEAATELDDTIRFLVEARELLWQNLIGV